MQLLKVNQEDIDSSSLANEVCPILQAAKRQGLNAQSMSDRLYCGSAFETDAMYKRTKSMFKFMKKFDQGEEVKPQNFRLIKLPS